MPWKLLTDDGRPPTAEETWRFCIQAHFSDANQQRVTINDVVREECGPREQIFAEPQNWGRLRFVGAGPAPKPPPVRLADGREFAVRLQRGVPLVDWAGFVRQEPPMDPALIKELTPARREALRALVRRLGSEQASDRERTRRELRAVLLEALPVLEEFQRDPDPEIRLSVRELLESR